MNSDDYIKKPITHIENPVQRLSDIMKFLKPKKKLDSGNVEPKSPEKK